MSHNNRKVWALICAGGSGTRFGSGELPKQLLQLAGRPILAHTLKKFQHTEAVDEIILVSHPDHIQQSREIAQSQGIDKLTAIVPGGSTRQESVYNGLQSIEGADDDIVVIHDVVRPLIDPQKILESIEAAIEFGASVVCTQTVDTILVAENSFIKTIPDRKGLRNEQTPATFQLGLIKEAHQQARQKGLVDVSDDVLLILASGGKVKLVEGPATNLKITTTQDLALAELLLKETK